MGAANLPRSQRRIAAGLATMAGGGLLFIRALLRRRLLLVAAFVALAAGVLLLARSNPEPEPPEQHAARLSREHGLIVNFGAPSGFYTPPYGPSDAQAEGVEIDAAKRADVSPALDGIEESLAKYPAGFVASVAHAIFIGGRIRFQGVDSGGTFGPAWIVLIAPSFLDPAAIRLTNLIGVHHELSSLVLRRNPFSYGGWTAFLPVGWQFTNDGKSSLARAKDLDPPPSTGFLSAYGATTAENDFNVYVEKMFTEPQKVARLAHEYPLIARKVAFVIATYAAVDPRLTETFRSLGLGAFVGYAGDAVVAPSGTEAPP